MDKDTRNRIQRATQAARELLEHEYAEQLEGVFDIRLDGTIAADPGEHLDASQRVLRTKLVTAIEHQRASGMTREEAVAAYLREAAFTTLNRFVALKMLEARDLVQECISRGDQSTGFKEFTGLAPGLVQLPDHGYRVYIESLFDEIGREVRVLFDRRDPASLFWPRRQGLLDLLGILNAAELGSVWGEDETIGWVYQYFNNDEERRDMRAESQAPRNSRELAVRNQFFTPRYVVRFLTDNTLGRIWYEMRQGDTRLRDLDTLVRRPNEVFLAVGEAPSMAADDGDLSQEEMLQRAVYVPFRAKKDPRDIRVLDPACGSGHFLLYAFDLLSSIYEEAWADEASPASEVSGGTLRDDYPKQNDLRAAVPVLILRHNLHGIDIDARCAQIAALALWMRAQRECCTSGLARNARPVVQKTNIVLAEPMPGEADLRREFTAGLEPRLGALVGRVFECMDQAGEAGALLPITERIRDAVRELYAEVGGLFEATDRAVWAQQVVSMIGALHDYAEKHGGEPYQRRLFSHDAAQGLGFIGVCATPFDVVLMNPPFGNCSSGSRELIFSSYGRERIELGGCFITRFLRGLAPGGKIGVVANRTLLFAASLEEWRTSQLSGVEAVADLGHGVLDALVEVAAFTVSNEGTAAAFFAGALDTTDKEERLVTCVRAARDDEGSAFRNPSEFSSLFGSPFAYWAPNSLIKATSRLRKADDIGAIARQGLATCDNFRFLRLAHELLPSGADAWRPLTKGGEYQPFWSDVPLRVKWQEDGREVKAYIDALHGQWSRVVQSTNLYGFAGATYSERTASSLSLRVLPAGCLFDKVGPFVGAEDRVLSVDVALVLIGLSYTTPYRFLIETAVGLRDATTSGSAARHYLPSMIQRLPWPEVDRETLEMVKQATTHAIEAARSLVAVEEGTEFWHEPFAAEDSMTLEEYATVQLQWWREHLTTIYESAETLEESAIAAFGVSSDTDIAALEEVAGRSPLRYPRREVGDVQRLQAYLDAPADELISELASQNRAHATTYKKAYWGERSLELLAHLWETHPLSLLKALDDVRASRKWCERAAWRLVSIGLGVAIQRLDPAQFFCATCDVVNKDVFAAPAHERRNVGTGEATPRILVDDQGHRDDLLAAVEQVLVARLSSGAVTQVAALAEAGSADLRQFLAGSFFGRHLAEYSAFRRKAPIYWQLGTASARYSLWLYYHHLSRDTLYSALNDYLTPKMSHEERRLTRLVQDAGPSPSARERSEIAVQERFVDELRVFRNDVARVAPLWNPNLNDGVIINFAPLWRLVPHHRAWQKECKSTWDKLCKGDYDWAHLAMHLWPERVVPKCAKDRSLAIAHHLEDVFWYEDSDGKWQPLKVGQAEIEKLIKERTSAAIKDALKSLLEAPAPATQRSSKKKAPRVKGTRRRAAPTRPKAATNGAPSPGHSATKVDGELLSKVKEAIGANGDGASKADVIDATGVSAGEWNKAIKTLLADGSVTQTGERRGARYHLAGGEA